MKNMKKSYIKKTVTKKKQDDNPSEYDENASNDRHRTTKKNSKDETTEDLMERLGLPKVHPKSKAARQAKSDAEAKRREKDQANRKAREEEEAKKKEEERKKEERRKKEEKEEKAKGRYEGWWKDSNTHNDTKNKRFPGEEAYDADAKEKKTVSEGWANFELSWDTFLNKAPNLDGTRIPWPRPNLFRLYLSRSARAEDAQARYKAIVRRFHPDKFRGAVAQYLPEAQVQSAMAKACELAKQVNAAFGK